MAFHSYAFILGVLPVIYAAFLLAYRFGGWPAAFNLLAVASLAFYGQFGLGLLAILLASVSANYAAGAIIGGLTSNRRLAGAVLVGAVVANLAALGYLKYANFLVDIANQLTQAGVPHVQLIVPIGVSFFTFVQIGYLVEAYNGQVERVPFTRYVLFSTFFPAVTAGPLVLQREMLGQLGNRSDNAFDAYRLSAGLTLFAIGLFKKVVLADSIAPIANAVFDGTASGMIVATLDAWLGSTAYALQLYFDFSGYSDMAIGLGLIFGIRLPLNFDSPLKATSISDFWRRWHMTMTRFFTTYVFTPLAMRGMRHALGRGKGAHGRLIHASLIPVVVTFLVAGVWHGAGWTFIVYGLIHGVALAINQAWRELRLPEVPSLLGWFMTMAVVVSGLVVFRAPDLATAGTLLSSMWLGGMFLLPDAAAVTVQVDARLAISLITLLGSIVLLMPNSQQMMHRAWPSSDAPCPRAPREAGLLAWGPNAGSSLAAAAIGTVALASIGASSTFLYYQF